MGTENFGVGQFMDDSFHDNGLIFDTVEIAVFIIFALASEGESTGAVDVVLAGVKVAFWCDGRAESGVGIYSNAAERINEGGDGIKIDAEIIIEFDLHKIGDGKHSVFDVGAHKSAAVGEFVFLFGVMEGDVVVAGDASDENLVGFGVDAENHVDIAELIASVDTTDENIKRILSEVEGFLRFGGGRVSGSDFVDEGVSVAEIAEGEETEGGECDLDDEGEEDGEGF